MGKGTERSNGKEDEEGVREGMWGGTAKPKDHLRSWMEN